MVIVDQGLHPLDERYIAAYALRGEPDASGHDGAGQFLCPLCLGELVLTHRRRRGFGYFRHDSEADASRCPLATTNYQLEGLRVGEPQQPLVAKTHRARFLYNWKRHLRIARSVVPSLRVERFIELIEYADVLGLWSYSSCELADVPYVLLVLAGFIAVRDRNDERMWVRFWFDGHVRDMGDLWRADAPRARLFRLCYRTPVHTPYPTAAELLHWESVVQIERLSDLNEPGIGRADMRIFDHFLTADATRSGLYREASNAP